MKEIIKYRANDGTEFDNMKECMEHDEICKKIKNCIISLGKPYNDPDCNFANGYGYIHHNILKVEEARDNIKQFIAKIKAGDKYIFGTNRFIEVDIRLKSIDSEGREWGQPYFASHSNGREEICLEDRRK